MLIDTEVPELEKKETFEFGDVYDVTGRSLLLFIMER